MPELPEVETIAEALREGGRGGPGNSLTAPSIVGMRVEGAEVLWGRTLATPALDVFTSRLPGQAVLGVSRRGKFLLLQLERDWLIFHLRMSGDLYLEPRQESLAAHHRLVVHFEGGWRLAFNDARKFGRAWLVEEPALVTAGLGPEPFDPQLTPEVFHARLRERRRLLKPLLLDQTFLAGMGNIYSDEALHQARLHPLALSSQVSQEQAKGLLDSIRQVLAEGIQRQGSSIDWVYRGGDFQNYFRVYQRTSKPCPVCGTPIARITVGQRSTHYCPSCQPDPT